MGGTFSNLSFHLVFSTRDRLPLITRSLRQQLYPYLGGIAREMGATAIAIGGMSDHVHLVARMPTTLCVADLVRTVKANSSRWMNESAVDMKFGWQRGYGAFSVSESAVAAVVQYVRNQEQHHRRRSFDDELKIMLTRHGIEFDERYLC